MQNGITVSSLNLDDFYGNLRKKSIENHKCNEEKSNGNEGQMWKWCAQMWMKIEDEAWPNPSEFELSINCETHCEGSCRVFSQTSDYCWSFE